ncbi:MAG: PilW family protein [Gammaproteobacteria bacterium]|nr:PilW family protein [Gammaproteobacteria bacterium]MDH5799448.1 PilW family protein [Gammaproteobacteria bacterium]
MTLNKESGLSLIELMVAMVLGLLVTGAIGTLFIQNKISYKQSDEIGYIQDNGRYALKALVNELEMVHFWGGYTDPALIKPEGTISLHSCQPTTEASVTGRADNGTATYSLMYYKQFAGAEAKFGCVAGDYKVSPVASDFLRTKRVKGEEFTGTHVAGQMYFRTDYSTIRHTYIAPQDMSAYPGKDWEYKEHLFYIDQNHQLVRQTMIPGSSSTPSMRRDVLVEGIEYFHIVFGLDTDKDGFVDTHKSGNLTTDLRYAISAQVYVLARSKRAVDGYTNAKSYQLGDIYFPNATDPSVATNDGYYRRVFSTTAVLRNTYIVSRMAGGGY